MLFPGSAAWTRTTALAAIKLGGIVLVTVVLVHLASDALSSIAAAPTPLTGPGPVPETGVPRVSYAQPSTSDLAIVVFSAMFRSLLLVLVAVVWGALVGLGSAYLVQLRRTSGLVSSAVAVAAWITPTFLLAAFAQEVQAQIFNLTDARANVLLLDRFDNAAGHSFHIASGHAAVRMQPLINDYQIAGFLE